jgi:transcriptional regulator with XRE-family HTH domain
MADRKLNIEEFTQIKRVLGLRIAELRAVAQMSQTEAAARSGIDRRHWIRIEKGETAPGLESLLQIQMVFELDTLESLFGPTTGDLLGISPHRIHAGQQSS